MPISRLLFAVVTLGLVAPVGAQPHGPTGQSSPAVACRADGSFIVVWQSWGQDGNDQTVLGQRFDSTGTKVGDEFRVNSYTVDRQAHASVCTSGNDFVVAWNSYGQDGDGYGVFAQRFDSAGATVGDEFQVNQTLEYSQMSPALACATDGGFVVVWSSAYRDGEDYGIAGRFYASTGAPTTGEFLVNAYTSSSQVAPAISGYGNGNFVVAWTSYEDQDGDGYGIFAQRFDSIGSTAAPEEFRVNSYTPNSQLAPSVTTDADGQFVVAWSSGQTGDDGYGIFAQRYDSAGGASGTELHVNTATAGDQGVSLGGGRVLSVAGTAGQFVAVWQSSSLTGPSPDGDGIGVFGQRFSGAPPQPVGSEFQVNTFSTGDQAYPSVCAVPGGGFVVVWEGRTPGTGVGSAKRPGNGIFARLYDNGGTATGQEVDVDSGTVEPPAPCTGDCDRNDRVTVDEILTGVGIALGEVSMQECSAADPNEDSAANVDELATAVRAALKGCPGLATKTPRSTRTPVDGERTRRPQPTFVPTRTPVVEGSLRLPLAHRG